MYSEMKTSGHVFWLFGLSGAGKTTLATMLTSALRQRGIPVLTLDGDVLRTGLCEGLGFSATGRTENLRRAAAVARLAVDSGIVVVASFITPLQAHRDLISGTIGCPSLSLVYLQAPLAVCQQRDVKGLYRQAHDGRLGQMTGVTAPFEPPARADLMLDTENDPADACLHRLLEHAVGRLGL